MPSPLTAASVMMCPTPHPCVSVKWDVTAQHVKHDNDFVLDESSVGLCVAGDKATQGTVLILAAQPQTSGL